MENSKAASDTTSVEEPLPLQAVVCPADLSLASIHVQPTHMMPTPESELPASPSLDEASSLAVVTEELSAASTSAAKSPVWTPLPARADERAEFFKDGSDLGEQAASHDEGDGKQLLLEVVGESTAPDREEVRDDCGPPGALSRLVGCVVRWPLRLLRGAIQLARKVFTAMLGRRG
jgi:hypothetical protein